MVVYQQTQRTPGLVWAYAIACILTLALLIVTGNTRSSVAPVVLGTLAVVGLVVLLLSKLTVQVTTSQLRLWFGPGLFLVRYELANLLSIQAVEVGPLAGAGIRRVDGGWLFRIRDSELLELNFVDGGRVIVGTDDLSGLARALAGWTQR